MTKFIHMSDPHFSMDYTGRDIMLLCEKTDITPTEQFKIVMEHIRNEYYPEIDFFLLSGDVVQDGSVEEYEHFRGYINELTGGKPCYATTGNHDSNAFWQGWFGENSARPCLQSETAAGSPFDYSFIEEKSRLKIICLDSRGGPYGSGVLQSSQLKLLRDELSDGGECIIMLHHTPHIGDDEYLKYQMQSSREFYETVRGGNVLGIFTGHTHIRFESTLGDIPCHTAPSMTFGLIVEGHTMTATDTTGYNYCTYSDGKLTVQNILLEGTGARASL